MYIKCKICERSELRPNGLRSGTSWQATHLRKGNQDYLDFYTETSKQFISISKEHSILEKKKKTIASVSRISNTNEKGLSIDDTNDLEKEDPFKPKLKSSNCDHQHDEQTESKQKRQMLIEQSFQQTINSIKMFCKYEYPLENETMNELSYRLTEDIKKMIATNETRICISVEKWENDSKRMLLGFTAHYIDYEFRERHHSFGLRNKSPTRENIDEILKEWNVKEDVNYFVTECNDFPLKNFPCACQTLNVIATEILTPGENCTNGKELNLEKYSNELVPALLIKCKQFYQLFSQISKQTVDFSSKWTSIYSLMNCLLENKNTFDQILTEEADQSLIKLKDAYPSEDEFAIISDLSKLFEFLKGLSVELSKLKYTNCSLLFPSIYSYLQSLNEISLKTSEISSLKYKLIESIKRNFNYLLEENAELFLAISFLDYRFKHFKFLNNEILADFYHQKVRQFLTREYSDYADELCKEINSYLKLKPQSFKEKPLLFHKRYSNKFPVLSKIARELLCIPSSATPTDRVFLIVEQPTLQTRMYLDSPNIELITFIRQNFELN